MLNPSTNPLPRNELNCCTMKLLGTWRSVSLRNGTQIKARAYVVSGDTETYIWSPNRDYMWELNGESVTNSEYDIMEVL